MSNNNLGCSITRIFTRKSFCQIVIGFLDGLQDGPSKLYYGLSSGVLRETLGAAGARLSSRSSEMYESDAEITFWGAAWQVFYYENDPQNCHCLADGLQVGFPKLHGGGFSLRLSGEVVFGAITILGAALHVFLRGSRRAKL